MPGEVGLELPGRLHSSVGFHFPASGIELGRGFGEIRSRLIVGVALGKASIEEALLRARGYVSRGGSSAGEEDRLLSENDYERLTGLHHSGGRLACGGG